MKKKLSIIILFFSLIALFLSAQETMGRRFIHHFGTFIVKKQSEKPNNTTGVTIFL